MSNLATYYHATNAKDEVLNAIMGSGKVRYGFHMTPSKEIARNYGAHLIKITFEEDLKCAHIGMIEKEGNHNPLTGHGIEVVLKDDAAIREFYMQLDDAVVIH